MGSMEGMGAGSKAQSLLLEPQAQKQTGQSRKGESLPSESPPPVTHYNKATPPNLPQSAPLTEDQVFRSKALGLWLNSQ